MVGVDLRSKRKQPMRPTRIRFGKIVLGHNRASWVRLLHNSPCSYCGAKLTKLNRSIDHIRPRAKFDTTSERWRIMNDQTFDGVNNNTASACRSCNEKKGTKELLHFMLERLEVAHVCA